MLEKQGYRLAFISLSCLCLLSGYGVGYIIMLNVPGQVIDWYSPGVLSEEQWIDFNTSCEDIAYIAGIVGALLFWGIMVCILWLIKLVLVK